MRNNKIFLVIGFVIIAGLVILSLGLSLSAQETQRNPDSRGSLGEPGKFIIAKSEEVVRGEDQGKTHFPMPQETRQEGLEAEGRPEPTQETAEVPGAVEAPVAVEELEAMEEARAEPAPGRVTVDFKEADIRNVLRVLALKGGVNIVSGKDVEGTVTVRLTDVPWDKALDVILSTHDFGYERVGDIITVSSMEKLTAKMEAEAKLAEVQSAVTRVFQLKYLDAGDLKTALEPQLSEKGKISILQMTGQAGWEFGAGSDELTKLQRQKEVGQVRSKILVVSDIPPVLERIKEIVERLDVEPKQILIEARIMEVNRDRLTDMGFDWGTGSSGASSSDVSIVEGKKASGELVYGVGGHSIGGLVSPSIFGPEASAITSANTGLKLLFRKVKGAQFEAILHMLEENVGADTLSAPRILVMDNQEASILVGTKYPIVVTTISEDTGRIEGASLDKYQDIGIQLNVVPQICAEKYISMIIHPSVTSYTDTVKTTTETGVTLVEYPIIIAREAETRIILEDGEVVIIGGLLKEVESKSVIGIPILKDIPLLGALFRRETKDTEKIDLLIFITASIVKPGEFTEEELALLKQAQQERDAEVRVLEEERASVRKEKARARREEIRRKRKSRRKK